jgi:hypothetical protein
MKKIPKKYILILAILIGITVFIIGQINNYDSRIQLDKERLQTGQGYPGNILTAMNATFSTFIASTVGILTLIYNFIVIHINKKEKTLTKNWKEDPR